jgi:hypothetical protein
MRRFTIPTARPAALLAGLVAVGLSGLVVVSGAPAVAGSSDVYELQLRPEGLPSTDVAARQILSGTLALFADRDRREVTATVQLAGEPTPVDDAQVLVRFGDLDSPTGPCVITWERRISTFAPQASPPDPADVSTAATREGTTLEVTWSLTPEQFGLASGSCAEARVVDPVDDQVLDGLDGVYAGGVISDPVYLARLGEVSGRLVHPRRWSTIRVEVRSRSDVRGFAISGRGKAVEVRPLSTDRQVQRGDTTTVRVDVRLTKKRPACVTLFLDTYGSAFGPVDSKQVRLVPRQRP